MKNSGGNDLVEHCCGKMKLDDVKNFVLFLDQKDGIMLRDTLAVEDDPEDDTDTKFDSKEENDDKSTITEILNSKTNDGETEFDF